MLGRSLGDYLKFSRNVYKYAQIGNLRKYIYIGLYMKMNLIMINNSSAISSDYNKVKKKGGYWNLAINWLYRKKKRAKQTELQTSLLYRLEYKKCKNMLNCHYDIL